MRVPVLAVVTLAALATLLANPRASAADYKVTMKLAIPYAEHDGVRLLGDLYLPEGRSKAPVVVAFHGGAWRSGSRTFFRYWGPFLARNGYAPFTVDYRLQAWPRYLFKMPRRRSGSCAREPTNFISIRSASG